MATKEDRRAIADILVSNFYPTKRIRHLPDMEAWIEKGNGLEEVSIHTKLENLIDRVRKEAYEEGAIAESVLLTKHHDLVDKLKADLRKEIRDEAAARDLYMKDYLKRKKASMKIIGWRVKYEELDPGLGASVGGKTGKVLYISTPEYGVSYTYMSKQAALNAAAGLPLHTNPKLVAVYRKNP